MNRVLKRGVTVCLVVMMLITQSGFTGNIYSQNVIETKVEETDDSNVKQLTLTTRDTAIAKAVLLYEGEKVNEIDLAKSKSFKIHTNGTYTINGLDSKDNIITSTSEEVDEFEDITLQKTGPNTVKVVSRFSNTAYGKVKESSEEKISFHEGNGVFESSFIVNSNGVYSIEIFDVNDTILGEKDITIAGVETKQYNGVIELYDEQDFEKIVKHPGASFILKNDIEITNAQLTDVNFTGTIDGNGYVLKSTNETFFKSLDGATIQNITLQGSALATSCKNSHIINSGFYILSADDEKDTSLLLHSENTIIHSSYVLANIEAKHASAFVLYGSAIIIDCYVSGYIKGEEVYGFGKDVEVKNSYLSASLLGNKRVLFTSGKQKGNFYDAQINDVEDVSAQAYLTKQMISKDLDKSQFTIKNGLYPQIKGISSFHEEALKQAELSTIYVTTKSNLSALDSDVRLKTEEEVSWLSDGVEIHDNVAKLEDILGEVQAESKSLKNRFSFQAVSEMESICAGISTTSTKTQISFPVTMYKYYKVVKTGEEAGAPTTHQEAFDSGWKLMYWSGNYKQGELLWNTQYSVYESDLTQRKEVGSITTYYGKNGGNVSLTGTYDLDETLTATISKMNSKKGTIYWESANTMDADEWENVRTTVMDGNSDTDMYKVTKGEVSKYLRVRFVVDQNTTYVGEVSAKTINVVKQELEKLTITNADAFVENKYTLGDILQVEVEPNKEDDVTVSWYHKDDLDRVISTSKSYTIKDSDVGKQLVAKATAKREGSLKGSVYSEATSIVEGIQLDTPNKNIILEVSKDDLSVSLKVNADKGLYRFAITKLETDTPVPYETLCRAQTGTTITGLSANTTYYVRIQQIGENGYLDSLYSDAIMIKTEKDHVRGDVVITGKNIYSNQLKAELENGKEGQTGEFYWYRLDENGNTVEGSEIKGNTYDLKLEDIGKKVTAIYKATGNYDGEVSSSSEVIEKAEKDAPIMNVNVEGQTDTTLRVQMPESKGTEKFIIGLAISEVGTPNEYTEDNVVKTYAGNEIVTITGLERDKTYYIYVCYAESDTNYKSDWIESEKKISATTHKKNFVGSIEFEYENETKKLMPGQTLRALLKTEDTEFNYKGDWEWYQVKDGIETKTDKFTLAKDRKSTAFVVPDDDSSINISYKVKFVATSGYQDGCECISHAVVKKEKEKYEAVDASFIEMEAIDDTSIKVKMSEGEGQYRFWYKKETSAISNFFTNLFSEDDGFIDTGKDVYNNVEVVIEGLQRNTNYVIRVQRIEDSGGLASDFTTANTMVKTQKTSIAGHIEISGTERFGETLTATYVSADYSSLGDGDDTSGSWQWYRGSDKINGATNASYVLQAADVGNILYVEYAMIDTDDFSGKTQGYTRKINKMLNTSPSVTNISSRFNSSTHVMNVTLDATTGSDGSRVYYRIQKDGEAAPTFPESGESLRKWSENTTASVELSADSEGREFDANGKYIVYILKTETPTMDATAIIPKDFTIGKKTQIGSITLSGRTHVGKESIATINGYNNTMGEWHWYYSKTDYTVANPGEWTEILDGFSPKENSPTSSLIVPDQAKGRYLRAEFRSTDDKVVGSVSSPISTTSVTKTMTEKLEISGKGYAEETIKVTMTGSDRDFTKTTTASGPNQLFGTKVVQLQTEAGAYVTNFQDVVAETSNTFEIKIPASVAQAKEYDKLYISTVVNMPDTNIYTKENGDHFADLFLPMENNKRIQYHYGIPISTADDLVNFMTGTGAYVDRSAPYVMTDNINLSAKGAVTTTETEFSGIFDGQFHTISYAKNRLISVVNGKSSKYAEIKNLIFTNGNIASVGVEYQTGAVCGQIKYYTNVNKVFALNTNVVGDQNTGLIAGFIGMDKVNPDPLAKTVSITECGTAGGTIESKSGGASIGGLAGFAPVGVYKDNFSVNTTIKANGGYVGGFIGHGSRGGGDEIQRNYTTANFNLGEGVAPKQTGAVIGGYADSTPTLTPNISNNFFDNQVITNSSILAQSVDDPAKGTGRTTNQMISSGLISILGSSLWSYSEGFYPRLTWMKDLSIAKIYTATKGAFVSVDGNTSKNQMMNGQMYGALMIPEEFQTSDYTVTSSSPTAIRVVGNVLIPVISGQSAKITITYKDPDKSINSTAVATFNFEAMASFGAYSNVSVSGTPAYGSSVDATISYGPSTNTYQWYRRKSGTTSRELIRGANSSRYTIKPEDIGYELAVEVSASGYATTMSAYSDVVSSLAPAAPIAGEVTDSTIQVKENGISGIEYEFAYALDATSEKVILNDKYATNTFASVERLSRNKTYLWYARIAGGSGYSASPWSSPTSITTNKTTIVGDVILGSNLNNGASLSLSASTSNNQTGVWKLERIASDSESVVSLINNSYSTSNIANYTLTVADVGYRIKATFSGSNDFQGSKSSISGIIKKSTVSTPLAPTVVGVNTDTEVMVKVGIGGNYDIGYAKNVNDTPIVAFAGQGASSTVTIPNLERNTTYFIFQKLSSTASTEESGWSAPVNTTTAKSAVEGEISLDGALKTDETITFTAPDINTQTGNWKLERMNSSNASTTISPSNYTIDDTGRIVTYLLTSHDANMKLKATFSGNANFNASITTLSSTIMNADQTDENLPSNVTIVKTSDEEVTVKADDGNDIYQFGYVLQGADENFVNIVGATATKLKEITIPNLERNTTYDIYIRKAAKKGYNEGPWVKKTSVTTKKTELSGNITYSILKDGEELAPVVGEAKIDITYKATYHNGVYSDHANDETEGYWQWYADDTVIEGITSDTYTVGARKGTPEISVRYIAKDTSDFSEYKSVNIGTLTKNTYAMPLIPDVSALEEDNKPGSKLRIQTSDDVEYMYYYIQKATNTKAPAEIYAKDAQQDASKATADMWFKAEQDISVLLEANTEYVVYASRLQDDIKNASGVVSQRAVKTVKENITNRDDMKLSEADDTSWKILQDKQLRITNAGKAVNGVWQYYVSKTPTIEESWQNVTSEVQPRIVEGYSEDGTYSYANVNMPVKFSDGYFIRVVFTGRQSYAGTQVYESKAALLGKQIKGHVEIDGGIEQANKILLPITARYVYGIDEARQVVEDEANGVWQWYRETAEGSNEFEIIQRARHIGLQDTYTPTAQDINRKIYALYTAAPTGIYSGSAKSDNLQSVEKADQNVPNNLQLKQVNGTTIQFVLPENYKTNGKTLPLATIEYRIKGSEDWVVNTAGDAWIGKNEELGDLKADTIYEVRARFDTTSEYKQSAYTQVLEVTSDHQLFDEDQLNIQSEAVVSANDILHIEYSGKGYQDGYFVIKRSDNQIALDKIEGTIVDQKNTLDYTCTSDDIGSNLIVTYVANEESTKYAGYIEKSTTVIQKATNPVEAKQPVLKTKQYDETILTSELSSAYEYVLTTSNQPITVESQWKKLTKQESETHTFADLDVNTTYYLHARLAETSVYRTGEEQCSAGLHPWLRGTFKIEYLGMDGAINGNPLNPNPEQYDELSADITLQEPTKEGYTFTGWLYEGIDEPVMEVLIPTHSTKDRVYTATWQINSYEINYETNGGTSIETITRDFNTLIEKPADPDKIGYTFLGWYKDSAFLTPCVFGTDVLKKDTTLYAKYKINQYRATFDGNGGSNGLSLTRDYDEKLRNITESTRSGYTFLGWYTQRDGGTKINADTTMPAQNMTYFAQWKETLYTITYELDEGEEVSNPTSYTITSEDVILAEPVKLGYQFLGWTFDGQEEPTKQVIIKKGSVGNKIYHANYKQLVFDITYVLDGGINSELNPSQYTVKDSFKLEIPRKEGYSFIGWTSDDILDPTPSLTIAKGTTGNKEYTAHWKKADVKVTFATNGGNDIEPLDSSFGSLLHQPEQPIRRGYTFVGWYKDEAFNEEWDFEHHTISANMTLYAKWKIESYNITYESENGSEAVVVQKTYGSVLGTITNPVKAGYRFLGWFEVDGQQALSGMRVSEAKTYYAHWEAIEYTITYNLDEGTTTIMNPIVYTIESDDLYLQQPSKEGYVFEGWTFSGQDSALKEVVIKKGSTGNKTFTAQYRKASYTLDFVSNGGTTIDAVYVAANGVVSEPLKPTRKGYAFTGWYRDRECNNKWNFETEKVSEDMTLYAGWKLEEYKVTLDSQNDEEHMVLNKSYGSEIGTLQTPEKTGYTFEGWFSARTGGQNITEEVIVEENVTYYAHWTPIQYQIQYDVQSGTNNKDNPSVYTIETGTIHIKAPYRNGYAFLGWTSETQLEPILDYTIKADTKKDITLVANWQQSDYRVIFDTQGSPTPIESVDVLDGALLTKPEDPTWSGHQFNGWYLDAQGTLPWQFEQGKVTQDITLYAKWSIESYIIKFDANGGNSLSDIRKEFGESLGTLPIPTRKYYVLDGWYTKRSGGEKINDTTKVDNHVTYYAHWTPIPYTITYQLDGGTESVDSVKTYSIETETFTLLKPYKEGYVFNGWTYVGQSFPVKEVVINKGSSGDKVYTANWLLAKYKVDFDTQGGNELTSMYVLQDAILDHPGIPQKEGYTFLGWYKDAEATVIWNFEDDVVSEDTTLYAKWVKQQYVLKFDAQGGSTTSSITKAYKDIVGTLPETNRKAYTFDGWYTQQIGGTKLEESNEVTSNKTYYAQWTPVTYHITYELDGGNGNDNPATYTIESNNIVLAYPRKEHYAFLGWTYDRQVDPIKDVIIMKGSYGDKTLKANWKEADLTVKFESNGGSEVTPYYGLKDEVIKRPTPPTRKGYEFAGWYKDSNLKTMWDFNDVIDHSITLYAKWNIKSYTITFDVNKGVAIENNTKELVYNSEIGELPTTTRIGYTFAGWYEDLENGTAITDSTKVEDHCTYYAKWTPDVYQIEYNLQGGVNASSNPVKYTIESETMTLKQPKKTGYAFTGWTYEGQAEPVKEVKIETGSIGDKQFTANWIIKEYGVRYDVQGGTAIADRTGVHWMDTNLLPKKTPIKIGYTFEGWVDESDASIDNNTTYASIAKSDDVAYITLKANWKKNTEIKPSEKPSDKPVTPTQPAPTTPTVKEAVKSENKEVVNQEPTEIIGALRNGRIVIPEGTVINKGNGKTTISVGKGELVVVVSDHVEVKDMEDFINVILSMKQKLGIEKGSSIEIRVDVKDIAEKETEDSKLVNKVAKEKNLTVATIYDININVKEDKKEWISIRQLDEGVELVLPVEKELQNAKADFYAIRVHEGDSKVLNDLDKDVETVTVKTKLFSTYAIAYRINEAQGTVTLYYIIGAGAIVLLGTYIGIRKRKNKKEEKVSS